MIVDHLRAPSPSSALEVRIGTARRDLTAAFELVYRRYLAKDFIGPHPGRIVYHQAFGLTSSRTIVAARRAQEAGSREQIVATLTVVGDNPLGLQMEAAFAGEVRSLRDSGRHVAEITCLAKEPGGKLAPAVVFFSLTHFMIHYAYWRRYDDLLMTIHPRHRAFYRRCFRAEILGPCRPYGIVRGNPALCCRIDLHQLRRLTDPKVERQYFATGPPKTEFASPPMAPADHAYFCAQAWIAPDTYLTDLNVKESRAA